MMTRCRDLVAATMEMWWVKKVKLPKSALGAPSTVQFAVDPKFH